MSTVAELITPKTACDRRTLTVDDLAVDSFEIPSVIDLDGDTLFSDDDYTCGYRCMLYPGESLRGDGCVWNPYTEVCITPRCEQQD